MYASENWDGPTRGAVGAIPAKTAHQWGIIPGGGRGTISAMRALRNAVNFAALRILNCGKFEPQSIYRSL